MVRLRVREIIQSQGRSDYSVYKRIGMNWGDFKKLADGRTSAMSYEVMEALSLALGVEPGELFEYSPDEEDRK